jgi:hypothetical protein
VLDREEEEDEGEEDSPHFIAKINTRVKFKHIDLHHSQISKGEVAPPSDKRSWPVCLPDTIYSAIHRYSKASE